jgi:hypothetical protein
MAGSRPLRALLVAGRLRAAVVVLLVLDAAVAWVVVLGVYTFLNRVWGVLAGRTVPGSTLAEHWAQVLLARRLHGLVWLATAVVFLLWLHRVRRALADLGVQGLRFSPGWTVGAFLVPGLNLVWAPQAVYEVWRASDPGPAAPARVWPAALGPWIVAWWVLLVLAVLADPLPRRLAAGALEDVTLGRATLVLVGGQLLEIAAAALAVVVVRAIGRRQEARFGLGDVP